MVLKINNVDITPYIKNRGVKISYNDLDSSEAGRTLDGKMHRYRVASKVRIDITCRPLLTTEASTVLSSITPEFVVVEYTDPKEGNSVTKTMYSNNYPVSYLIQKGTDEWWEGITFPLIEQ